MQCPKFLSASNMFNLLYQNLHALVEFLMGNAPITMNWETDR